MTFFKITFLWLVYARYFIGDLTLSSIEGYGTEVFVYLQALESEAKERLPVYHETGSKKIYEAKLTPLDWTQHKSDNFPWNFEFLEDFGNRVDQLTKTKDHKKLAEVVKKEAKVEERSNRNR